MPNLRCIEEEEAKYILEEVYEGVCGDHTGLRSLLLLTDHAEGHKGVCGEM